MPVLPMDKLKDNLEKAEFELAQRIVVPATGALRTEKPPIKLMPQISAQSGCLRRINDLEDARAAVVWRFVAFQISPRPKHQCMPVCAEFDLPLAGDERRAMANELMAIANKIVDCVPPEHWHGVIRWGQAFGQIGTPEVREGGTIVYR
jgi:hypothetical protein